MDDDVGERSLRIDIEDPDLAVTDVQRLDLLADGLERALEIESRR